MDPKRKNKLKRKMRQFKKINFVRRIVQLVCFLLLPGFFIQIYSSTKALVVALLAGSFSLQANSVDLVVVLSVYPLTLLFGRFFCGWICAMGSLGDLLTSIRNGLKIKEHQLGESTDSKLKLIKYILLLFSIIFVWGSPDSSPFRKGSIPWTRSGCWFPLKTWICCSPLS